MATRREGAEHLNTFCLSLRNVKVPGSYPSEENINNFLWKTLTLDARNLFSVLSQKVKQNVLVSFIEECDVIQFENKICKGVIFPGTDSKVDSFSVDKPIITVTIIGAPHWVGKSDIQNLVGRWGDVLSAHRGTCSISSPEGV